MSPQQSIAHYRLSAKLGEGGMGAVYRATDTKLNRDVAIKVLPPAFAEDTARMQRFEREAQVLASLNHPNIAQIYGVEAGAIVMELVEGPDLAGPLPLDIALDYARQIAAGLEAAHEKGVVHRDLKPANIKVTSEGVVKILDFGLAKTAEPNSVATSAMSPTMSPTLSLAMTQAGMILGTAAYMSPEQARGKVADKRADIWAFGVVLYEMVTGRLPFQGEDVSHTMAAVILQEPGFDGIPASLHRLLKKCLEKDPKKRLRDIGDAWELLGEETTPAAATPAIPPAHSRITLAISIVAGLALVAAGALAFVHFREQPPVAPVTRFQIPLPDEVLNSLAISPDGRQIAICTGSSAGAHIQLRSLDTLETRVLAGTESATSPFWSPDSRYIGFAAEGKLKIVDSRGGPPQSITDANQFRGGAWSPSGTILYAQSRVGLKQIRASGGTPAEVPAGRLTTLSPNILPDGRHFVFTSRDGDGQGGIYMGSLDSRDPESRQPRRMLNDISRAVAVPGPNDGESTLLFVRETSVMGLRLEGREYRPVGDVYLIAEGVGRSQNTAAEQFSVSGTGTLIFQGQTLRNRKLTWYDRLGKVIGTVDEPGSYRSLSLSPDGTQLAVDLFSGGYGDIWLHDLVRHSKIRLTSEASNESNPVWSPDGKWAHTTHHATTRRGCTGRPPTAPVPRSCWCKPTSSISTIGRATARCCWWLQRRIAAR